MNIYTVKITTGSKEFVVIAGTITAVANTYPDAVKIEAAHLNVKILSHE